MKNVKRRKQVLSWVLTAGMAVSSLSGLVMGDMQVVQAADNTAPGKPSELKTEMLSEAYGLDTKNPAFSWVVNDADKDEVQSAYRIFVSKTSDLEGDVYATDWVESSESSFVHVPELEEILEDNQLYYWQVQTKDKSGAESALSDAAPFMTDIASEWQSMDGIWAVPEAELWTDYTVEQTVSIADHDEGGTGALAILMRMNEANTGYMVQLREDNTIECLYIANSSPNKSTKLTLKMADYGVAIPTDGSEFKVKMTAEDSAIFVEIDMDATDGVDEYTSVGTLDLTKLPAVVNAGMSGYRTGEHESGTVDDVTVTSSTGKILYTSDFSADDGSFSGCSVSNGKLSIGKSVFSAYSNPNNLIQLGNFSFFRSPQIAIEDKEAVDKAIISASCRGTAMDRGVIFDLYFNGDCIGAGSARELANVGTASGKTGYTKVYYNSYDVTDLLTEGDENVISAVGNCRDSNRGILVQMTVFYKDGTKEILTNSGVSNSGWKTLDGTNAFGDKGGVIDTGYVKLLQENINGEMYPTDWQEVDFDDSDWKMAVVNQAVADSKTGSSGRVLYPHSSENALRVETDEPTKKVYENTSGNVVVDLGKEIIGGIKIDLTSSKKQSVTVHMGEEMSDDGTVKYQLSAVPDYEDFWTLKEGENVFNTVTMRNFRYVEFIGLDADTKANMLADKNCVKGFAIQQKFDENDSAFMAYGSDEAEMLNRLYEFCKYTIKATNQDLFVDSQARERAAYEGDLLVNSNTSYAVSDNYSLARHSNEWLMDNPTWPNDYRLFSVEMAYWDYIYTGNTDSIKENYEALKAKLTLEVEYEDASTGLIRANGSQAGNSAIIDWPTSERDGYVSSYYDVVFNAEYVGIYQNMAILCEALGETEDATYYRAKSDKLKATLLEKAYDEENGCFYDSLAADYTPSQHSSTHATAYALAYGVFDSKTMADDMCAFVYNKCKSQFKGSVYVTYFILKGLYVGNHGEMAQKLMTNPKVGENVKTFASLLDDLHCTITPEAWGHNWKSNMTLSHPWGASPGCSIVQGMFGIMPTEAGFDEFSIKLQPGGIPSASIKAPSVKGPVYVSYTNGSEADLAANKLCAEVTIPVNSQAVVSLPVNGSTYGYLVVDGAKTEAEYDGTYLSVTLGSGTHTVSISGEKVERELEIALELDAEDTELEVTETAQIISVVTNQYGNKMNADEATLSYYSNDTDILTVDNFGVVKGVGEGSTTVEVAAEYNGTEVKKEIEFTIIPAVLALLDMDLSSQNGNALKVGDTTQTSLQAIYNIKDAETINAADITYSVEGDAVTVEANGKITAQKAGSAVIYAKTAAKNADLGRKVPYESIQSEAVWSFDQKTSPLNGVEVKDGKLYAGAGQKVTNTDSDKKGNIVYGTFEIENVAASIAFNVKNDTNRYFWQFREEGILKKHKECNGTIEVTGEVEIVLNEGENTFMIITENDKIYTWLNEVLIDVCDAEDSLPVSGGFGVRNGSSESFWLKDITVANKLTLAGRLEILVEEKVIEKDPITNITPNPIPTPDPLPNPNPSGDKDEIIEEQPVVKLNATSLPLQVKKSTNVLKASGLIAGDKVAKWESSKPSVATVNKKGKITAKKVGKTVITVTTEKGATASCTIKVQKKQVKTKKLNVTNATKNKITLKPKKSITLKVERTPLTATDKMKYTSSKKSVATVNGKGKVTAKKKGKAVITIKSGSGKKVKVTVTVK